MWWCNFSTLPVRAPVMFNFMPSWWARGYGLALGERIFLDPEYRAQTIREMYRLAHDRFGDVGLGQPDPQPVYCVDDLGNATLPAVFGCEVVFADDQYAANHPVDPDVADVCDLPQDVTSAFPMCEIVSQAKRMSERHGLDVRPCWATMGVLNAAVRTTGTELFADLGGNSARAHRMLAKARGLMLASIDYFETVGTRPPVVWNQNCTVPLLGPQRYERELLAYDLALYEAARERGMVFSIHHCGHFDPYAPLYRRVPAIDWIEIGWGSDLRLALDTFPETHIQVIIGHEHVLHGTPAQIRQTMREHTEVAGEDTARLSFNVPDLEHGTPDENVRAVVEGLLPEA